MSEAHDEVDELRERAGVDDVEDGGGRRMGNDSIFRKRFLGGSGGCELSREDEQLADVLGLVPSSEGLEEVALARRGKPFFGRRDTSLKEDVRSFIERVDNDNSPWQAFRFQYLWLSMKFLRAAFSEGCSKLG